MMNTETHNGAGWNRWLWILPVVFVLLLAGLRLSLVTKPVQNFVKNKIEAAVDKQISVNFSVEALEGDLWKSMKMKNILLSREGEAVATIDSLSVDYNILSYLTSVFEISELSVYRPVFSLKKKKDRWNIEEWIREKEEGDKKGGIFPVSVSSLNILEGTVNVAIHSLNKDSSFTLRNIGLESRLNYYGDKFDAGLSSLSFEVDGLGLDRAVSVSTEAEADEKSLSVEKIVIATGQSVVKSSGVVNLPDSTTRLSINAEPLSWRDITALAERSPIKQDIKAEVSVKGTLSEFQIGLNVSSDDIENLVVDAGIRWDAGPVVNSLEMKGRRMDLASFFGDSSLPSIRDINFQSQGSFFYEGLQKNELEGSFKAEKVTYQGYSADLFSGNFNWSGSLIDASVESRTGNQFIQADVTVNESWSSNPRISIKAQGKRINPGYWAKSNRFRGELNFAASISGKGLLPQDSLWQYRLKITDATLLGQDFSRAELHGYFNVNRFTNNSSIWLRESEIKVTAEADHIHGNPNFSYEISTSDFDLSEFRTLESFTSSISGSLKGKGQGGSLEKLSLSSTISIDSSIVNGELINKLNATIDIEDSVATVKEAGMESTIADGSFKAKINLLDLYSIDNNLNLDIEVKDLRALAPLVDSERIFAEGSIEGLLRPTADNQLKFDGNVDLSRLSFDGNFKSNGAGGNIEVYVTKNPEYSVDLNLVSPSFYGVELQDFNLQTQGRVYGEETKGSLNLIFRGSKQGTITHSASYSFSEDSISVLTNQLKVESPSRTLELQQPFNTSVVKKVVKIDTMRLAGTGNASLQAAAAYVDTTNYRGYLDAGNLNIAVIQDLLISKSYGGGELSGRVQFERIDTTLTTQADFLVENILYKGTEFDRLDFSMLVESDHLSSTLSLTDENKEIVKAGIELPYRIGNPLSFNPSFFEKNVEGSLLIDHVPIDRFDELLEEASILNTKGILTVRGELKGKAGEPQLEGDMIIDEAVISGVEVDSVTASLEYIHQNSNLQFNATVHSLKQNAAKIQAELPFSVDLRKQTLTLPKESDSVDVEIQTNKFNLAALNDFVNEERFREINGQLNGRVKISGQTRNLKADGELKLSKGSLRIIPAGVRVTNIKSALVFEPNVIKVESLEGKSGSGNLKIQGKIDFNKLIPGNLNLKLTADNFTATNTSGYKAAVNMNADVEGTFTQPQVSGSVTFVEGFVQMDNFGEKAVENVRLDSVDRVVPSNAIYDSLEIDMDISFGRRFYVRNQRFLELEAELKGRLDLLKDRGKELQVFGALSTASGYVLPLGKRFEITEGQVTFSGQPDNPKLNIRTMYIPPEPKEEIKIWYIIEGSVENPKFRYDSTPPMELENILSYTLFGKPFYELDSWQQVVANSGSRSTAADVAVEVLMDRVEALATKKLGIDVVKIDNTYTAGRNGTSITTGWYINPKVFFAIQNVISGSTPDTGFLLEYELTKNLKLIISQGNDSRQGVDLNWHHEY